MRVRLHSDVAGFIEAAQGLLGVDPFTTSVIAVVAERALAGSAPARPQDLWLTVNDTAGAVVGLAMHTPPHHLFISRMPAEAIVALADELAAVRPVLGGVNGEIGATVAFAAAWSQRIGAKSHQVTAMRMYRLGELTLPAGVGGTSRAAVAADTELVAGWAAAFHDEAQPDNPIEDWEKFASTRIGAERVHLWIDGPDHSPVAMAIVSAPAAGVARVGPVYTPVDRRRRGYGAAVTAAASGAALRDGAMEVVLYTDLANPTANAIYQAIGYRPHHDAEERAFIGEEAALTTARESTAGEGGHRTNT